MKKTFLKIAVAGISLFMLACNQPSSDTAASVVQQDSVAYFTVNGVVENENDEPLAGVKVSAQDTFVYTDSLGAFSLPACISGNRVLVKLEKEGYFYHICAQSIADTVCNRITMVPRKTSSYAYAGQFMANKEFSMTVDGGKVVIPANSLVTPDGKDYSGAVKMAVCYLNPDNNKFTSLMPGGDLCAINAASDTVQLISYGMVRVEMESDKGEKLQLKKGAKAKLSFPISKIHSKEKVDTIPLWYFNEETGLWQEEGLSVRKNGCFEGEVSHFTWWNCDVQFTRGGRLKVKFIDSFGKEVDFQYNIFFDGDDVLVSLYSGNNRYYSMPKNRPFKVVYWHDLMSFNQPAIKENEDRTLTIPVDSVKIFIEVVDKNYNYIPNLKGTTSNIPQHFTTSNSLVGIWFRVNGNESIRFAGDKKTYNIAWNDVEHGYYTLVVDGSKNSKMTDNVGSQKENNLISVVSSSTQEKMVDSEDDKVYVKVDTKAHFPGGMQGLSNFLTSNLRYPRSAFEKGIQGKVIVEFIVEKDGSLSDVKVARSIDPDLALEAMRVVRLMRGWIPAQIDGKYVRSKFRLPITFALQ